ncbi:uncharacterized protein LOC131669879 [Phymastichus coffea]|uniref:uncharacterized protein LOC131669879 n=1 Tax=Phymastichus coffea TaxID=108790 RepID=UPI00273BCBA9|nr:uncharacterized protein LOC131669879 [Phymastichus coffea]
MLICRLIQNTVLLQYGIIVQVITSLFRVLNKNLKALSSTNLSNIFSLTFESSSRIKMDTLAYIQHSYLSLSNLCQNLSDFYSIPMMFCSLSVFISLIATMYDLTKPLFMDEPYRNYIDVVINLFYFMQSNLPLLILVTSISEFTNETKKTVKIICDLLETIENQDIKRKLNNFSTCLLHSNNKFMIFDWISLDGSLFILVNSS